MISLRFIVVSGILFFIGCQRYQPVDPEQHRREIEEWRAHRLARLTRDDGWLTLVGLHWLKEGANTVGSDSTSDVILPAGKTPGRVGSLRLEKGIARFAAKRGVEVRLNDSVVTSLVLKSDADAGGPSILKIGTVSFYVIKRGERYAVRVKDSESPARMHFKGLEYFPIDRAWRVEARFEPYVPAKTLEIATQVGTVEKYMCPGSLVFEIKGKEFRLEPVIEPGAEDELFIMFADETNGKETYAVGRQMYAPLPDSNNRVIIDFNKAYNWPCVFTEYATCPIPPPQNRLPIRIEAGEKMYRGHE
jgi:uncharacterized protein (DUF1684 family)